MTDGTRLTVNLNGRSEAAMEWGAALGGETRTDAVNRALQLYAMLLEHQTLGRRLLIVDGNEATELRLLQ